MSGLEWFYAIDLIAMHDADSLYRARSTMADPGDEKRQHPEAQARRPADPEKQRSSDPDPPSASLGRILMRRLGTGAGPDDGASAETCEAPLMHILNGPCPYLPDRIWESVVTVADELPGAFFELFLNSGFRRTGTLLYRPVCTGCRRCIPIRVDVARFKPSKSQRRTWRKNQDIRIEHRPLTDTTESYALYERYQRAWHGDQEVSRENYRASLLQSPVTSEMVHYYQGDALVGLGFIDVLPSLVSSVYFVFEPTLKHRRLGVFSILHEIEYCRKRSRPWLYLGYWVPGSRKMVYKGEYLPAEICHGEGWMPIEAFDDDEN